jgi:hypothetical protein
MSKRIFPLLALALAFGVAAAALVANRSAQARSSQRASVATTSARNAAIVAATAEVLQETSEIRELSILRPVKSGAQSKEAIEQMLIRNLNEQVTPAEMRATELSLRKFGLAPRDFRFRQFFIKLLTEQVAGYYDPKLQRFHLADWLEVEGQKPVMSHELTHALQDQHFNLRRFEKWPHGDSDAQLAAHALIEGDATLAMTIYMAKNPLVALAFSRSILSGTPTEQFDQAPRAMRELLIFPYLQGSAWATQLFKKGGWAMVSGAFTKLPLSTEQILHVEKYFNYERPVKIVLPDLTPLLNGGTAGVPRARSARTASRGSSVKQQSNPSGWRFVDSDVNGEWNYYLILDQFLKTPQESKRAAAGWAGDRYAIYEGPNDQVLLAQLSAWDTESDAREFFDAYVKRTMLRYADAKESETQNSKQETRDEYSWQTGEGAVTVELRGSRVLILEGVPDRVSADGLRETLWR